MKVLFLVEGELRRGLSPAARYRVYQYLPSLERDGIRCVVSPSRPSKYVLARPWIAETLERHPAARNVALIGATTMMTISRLPAVWRSRRFDVVVLQRDLLPLRTVRPFLERAIASRNPRLVFDFDDAIYTHAVAPKDGPSLLRHARDPDKIGHILQRCRCVVAGNAHLASFARRWNPRTTVIPTVVDTDFYQLRESGTSASPLTIGWSGTHLNLRYLQQLAPTLQVLSQTIPFNLRIISDAHRVPLDFAGVCVEHLTWDLSREREQLSGIDIGVMPLPDDEWTRGKCGLKALQYMACGIPCVVSPVGVNAVIVRHGDNGLLARTPGEWHAALRALLEDPALRARLGAAGRRTVVDHYSVSRWAPELARILRGAAGQTVP